MPEKTIPQQAADSERVYPHLEVLLETEERAEACGMYEGTKAALQGLLAGPKASAAKKALAGIERAEALLTQLYDVRDQLVNQQPKGRKAR